VKILLLLGFLALPFTLLLSHFQRYQVLYHNEGFNSSIVYDQLSFKRYRVYGDGRMVEVSK
jgi:hypothetical protein